MLYLVFNDPDELALMELRFRGAKNKNLASPMGCMHCKKISLSVRESARENLWHRWKSDRCNFEKNDGGELERPLFLLFFKLARVNLQTFGLQGENWWEASKVDAGGVVRNYSYVEIQLWVNSRVDFNICDKIWGVLLEGLMIFYEFFNWDTVKVWIIYLLCI